MTNVEYVDGKLESLRRILEESKEKKNMLVTTAFLMDILPIMERMSHFERMFVNLHNEVYE